MIESVFRSEDLPVADRFDAWHELACRAHVLTMIRSDHKANFRATFRLIDLGAIQISSLTYPSLQPQRTQKLIRQSDPEAYCLSLTLRGSMGLAQSGREAVLRPNDLVLYDTSRPFHGWTVADDNNDVAGMVIQIPKPLLPILPEKLTRLTAVRLPGGEGVGAVFCRYLRELAQQAPQYTLTDATRLTSITLDLFAALYAHHLETDLLLKPETRRRALQIQIHNFIQQQLGDPTLSPRTIAIAHQISTRYLYQLFQSQGLTVASWIRQLRLERCRRDLADPQLQSHLVQVIAARWGFTDNAHFSRVFRTTYGLSPTDYRHLIQHDDSMRESSRSVHETPTIS